MININIVYFNNGSHGIEKNRKIKVKTIKPAPDEDWKTTIAHNIKPIPENTELICSLIWNYYGNFLKTEYNGHIYYIDSTYCNYIRMEN